MTTTEQLLIDRLVEESGFRAVAERDRDGLRQVLDATEKAQRDLHMAAERVGREIKEHVAWRKSAEPKMKALYAAAKALMVNVKHHPRAGVGEKYALCTALGDALQGIYDYCDQEVPF